MPTKKGAKWSKYKVRRRSALRFLVSLYNKKKQESVAILELLMEKRLIMVVLIVNIYS